jgi:predicted metalloprotease with PDZ domain
MLWLALAVDRFGKPINAEASPMKALSLAAGLVLMCLVPLLAKADVPPPYELYGIGAQVSEAEPFPVVSGVSKDSPADKAGVRKGDAVIAIDGSYPKGIPFYYFARGLKGKKDSDVELVLLRQERRVLVVKVKRTVRDR